MLIRQETAKDHSAVYELVRLAFATAEHSDGTEHELVEALRKNQQAFIPQLSLVAEDEGRIIGHILFTKIRIGDTTALALAPLSVSPDCQRQGVGTALIEQGHRIGAELGYPYSVVLGSEIYYPKSGYRPAEEFSIEIPEGVPAENYMAIKLLPQAKPVHGKVVYAAEFGM